MNIFYYVFSENDTFSESLQRSPSLRAHRRYPEREGVPGILDHHQTRKGICKSHLKYFQRILNFYSWSQAEYFYDWSEVERVLFTNMLEDLFGGPPFKPPSLLKR